MKLSINTEKFTIRPDGVKTRNITPREREIIKCITGADGMTNRQVAERLGIAVKTVETHRSNIMNKLGFRNVVQLMHYAAQNGIIHIFNGRGGKK